MIMRNLLGILVFFFLAPALAQDATPPDVLVRNVTLEVVELIAKDREIKSGNRAISPSSLRISQITAAGVTPAKCARSQPASV